MLAFSGGFVSAPIAPGVQIALNLINEDESLLPGYTLHYTFSDSEVCDRGLLESTPSDWEYELEIRRSHVPFTLSFPSSFSHNVVYLVTRNMHANK